METEPAGAIQQTQQQDRWKPKEARVEVSKEDEDNKEQKGHNNDIPKSKHTGSTQNSQPQPIAQINKTQGHGMSTMTHQERGGPHPPEMVNQASQ